MAKSKVHIGYFKAVFQSLLEVDVQGRDYGLVELPQVTYKNALGEQKGEASADTVRSAFSATVSHTLESDGHSLVPLDVARIIRSAEFKRIRETYCICLFNNPTTGKKGLLIKRKGLRTPVWELIYQMFHSQFRN